MRTMPRDADVDPYCSRPSFWLESDNSVLLTDRARFEVHSVAIIMRPATSSRYMFADTGPANSAIFIDVSPLCDAIM